MLEPDVLQRLTTDRAFFAEHCLRVVDEDGEVVPLRYRPAQMKVARAAETQRRAGLPVRIVVLKSRKTGVSTMVQGWMIQDGVMRDNRRGLVVAQDVDTAGELHDIGYQMWANIPFPEIKPKLAGRRRSQGSQFLHFGNPSQAAREAGDLGRNSTLKIDTAANVQAGRGKTITELHLSEAAFWEHAMGSNNAQVARGKAAKKALSVINAVPDRPGTFIVVESTANGHNFFKGRWDRAEAGQGGFVPVFIGWPEDENCWRAFPDPDARERFVRDVWLPASEGRPDLSDEAAADEPRLIEAYGCTPEQLNWRRYTIVDKADGSLDNFRQEYPSFPAEAFIASGKHVFSVSLIQRVHDRVGRTDPQDAAVRSTAGGVVVPPDRGVIVPAATKQRELAHQTVEVPTGGLWVPEEKTGFSSAHPFWKVWEHPKPDRQYIVFNDPARGEENARGESDYSAIQVIDHESLKQVAVYRSKLDPDLVAYQLVLAGLYFNEALVAVEVTDGLGVAIVKTHLWLQYGYRRLYYREDEKSPDRDSLDDLGWSTNRQTKPQMEAGLAQLLRQENDGIRDRDTAFELNTYVDHGNRQHGADTEAHDDLLMAYMGAQEVARRTPLRKFVGAGSARNLSSLPRDVRLHR